MELDKKAMFVYTEKMDAALQKVCPNNHNENIDCAHCEYFNLCTIITGLLLNSFGDLLGGKI